MPGRVRFLLALFLILSGPASAGAGGALERGRTALAAGRPRDALNALQDAVRAQPDAAEPHLLLGRAELALGNGMAAEAEIEKARGAGAPDAITRPFLAEAELLQGEPDEAEDTADPAHVAPALAGYAARIRARAAFVNGDAEAAEQAFALALRLAPRDPQLWADIARFRLDTGDAGSAEQAAVRAVALGPGLVDALLVRAATIRLQYGPAAAMIWNDRAVAADPSSVPALLDRAAANGDLGHAGAMLADARAVLRLDPHNARAFYLQAVLAARARMFALAGRLLDKAGGGLDDLPGAQLVRGTVDYATGRTEEAIEQLAHLVAEQPGNAAARRLLAAAQWKAGDAVAVVATLQPLVGPERTDPYALALTGRALERQGRRDLAADPLERSAAPWADRAVPPPDAATLAVLHDLAASHPNDAAAAANEVAALLAAGRGGQAVDVAAAFSTRRPGRADALMVSGDALVATGKPLAGAAAFRSAANLAFTQAAALRLVDALRRGGDAAGAFAVLNLFLGQHPQDVPARLAAADMLIAQNRNREAARLLEELAQGPAARDAALLNNLAWALYRTGRRSQALAIAGRAHALAPANAVVEQTLGWMLADSRADDGRGDALLAEGRAALPHTGAAPLHLMLARAEASPSPEH